MADHASLQPFFRFSRQAFPFSPFAFLLYCFLSLSFQFHSFTPIFVTITNYPYLSSHVPFRDLPGPISSLFFPSETDFFASDVSVFTKCLRSSFPPASYTPFSHHQCIRCCRQHYQLQYLCHWNHRRILKSVSVPPSTRDVAFHSCFRWLPSLPITTEYFHGPCPPTCLSRHGLRSSLPNTEHFHYCCKRVFWCGPATTLSIIEHFYGHRTCKKPCEQTGESNRSTRSRAGSRLSLSCIKHVYHHSTATRHHRTTASRCRYTAGFIPLLSWIF